MENKVISFFSLRQCLSTGTPGYKGRKWLCADQQRKVITSFSRVYPCLLPFGSSYCTYTEKSFKESISLRVYMLVESMRASVSNREIFLRQSEASDHRHSHSLGLSGERFCLNANVPGNQACSDRRAGQYLSLEDTRFIALCQTFKHL